MLPGRQDADDWLNFMLSQKNLWPTFTTRGTITEEISEQTFRKERRRLQAKHLWMEVKLRWNVLADRMYTKAPTGKSREQLNALLSTRLQGAVKRIPMRKKPTEDLHFNQSRHGGNNAKIGCNTSRVKVHHWLWT